MAANVAVAGDRTSPAIASAEWVTQSAEVYK